LTGPNVILFILSRQMFLRKDRLYPRLPPEDASTAGELPEMLNFERLTAIK